MAANLTKPKGRTPAILRDPTIQQRILDALRTGAFLGDAAAAGGVSAQTLYAYLDRGRRERDLRSAGHQRQRGEQPFVDILEAAEEAQASVNRAASRAIVTAFRPHDEQQTVRRTTQVLKRDGTVVTLEDETITTRHNVQDWRAAERFLRLNGRGAAEHIELTGADGAAIQIEVDLGALSAIGERIAAEAAALEVESRDVTDE